MAAITQQSSQDERSAAGVFWDAQMAQHPNVAGILAIAASFLGFFFNGHFIVALGRWILRVGGYVAESSLLFAVLWISATSVAPKLVQLFMSADTMQYLVWLAVVTLAIIPEIIVANAVINAIKHWYAACRHRENIMLWVWAVLFTIPAVLFLIITVITINSLGANHGDFVQASTSSINLRLDAGWAYGLLEMVYAGTKNFSPMQATVSVTPVGPVPAAVPPVQIDHAEIAQQLVPLLVPHFNEMRTSILAEVQQSVPAAVPPVEVNYQEIAQQLVPLLPAPSVPDVDPDEIARAVAPLLRPAFVEARRTIIEEVKAIMPTVASIPAQQPVAQITAPATTSEDIDLDRDARLENAYQQLLSEGKKPSGNALYVLAKCQRKAAQTWLQSRLQGGTDECETGTHEAVSVPVESGTAELAAVPSRWVL